MAAQESFINSMLDDGFTGTITMHLYYTGVPSGSGTEVTGGSYAAQTITMGTAASKAISATANAVFTDLPTGTAIVAWGIKKDGTLIDEDTLTTPFLPDIDNNTLELSYTFEG